MGSFWAIRAAARDQRLRACASVSACYGGKTAIFELASPRFKRMFMYMSGVHDEGEFDRMAERMTTVGYGGKISCPVLMIAGEYDPLCPLADSLGLFEELAGPKELWIMKDEFHSFSRQGGLGGLDMQVGMADWLHDVLTRGLPPGHAKKVLVRKNDGRGVYGEPLVKSVWEADIGL